MLAAVIGLRRYACGRRAACGTRGLRRYRLRRYALRFPVPLVPQHIMKKIAENRLREAGLRITKHRICVLAKLLTEARPISHLELLNLLADYKFDRVTLYRILSTLKDAGLVHQVQGTDGIWRFCAHDEINGKCPGGHPHLLCEVCGQMICLSNQKMPHFEVPSDFKVTHKQMLILGICANCQAK